MVAKNLFDLTPAQRLDMPYCERCDLIVGYASDGHMMSPGRCAGCGALARMPTLREVREKNSK